MSGDPGQVRLQELEETIAALKETLSEQHLGTALEPLVREREALLASLQGSGAVAQDGSVAAGERGVAAGRDVYVIKGSEVYFGSDRVEMPAVERESALGRYLDHVITRNRYLQLQGIRSGGRLVHIELDQIYVTLRSTRQRVVEAEEDWLAHEGRLAPGELGRRDEAVPETVTVSVNEALREDSRLVILGDPGSGKTTLLRHLALLYARDVAEEGRAVREQLGLPESGRLPVLFYLRQLGRYLDAHGEEATDGHKLLLDFLRRSLTNERIEVPGDFFDPYLTEGRAVVLFDGLDEVADPELRRRVSRLVEAFTAAYPDCRYVVSSRVVGYAGPARLGEDYASTTIQPFSLKDVESFLATWHRQVAVSRMGAGPSAQVYAEQQTAQLMEAIRDDERIRDLAINPLLLTVIALVHRDRVKLPDRRAELYGEAVDVLLGKWDEARGVKEIPVLEGQAFDTGDKRLLLQSLALVLHERREKEISREELEGFVAGELGKVVGEGREAKGAAERFLEVIEARTGLLTARGEGVYAFSHLTFQEYLAALAVAARDDYVAYTLARTADPWWREVVLLEAGYLSTQSKERCTRLIEAIARKSHEPEPYHNLVLAAECLRDVGGQRVESDLASEIQHELREEIERPPSWWHRWGGRKVHVERKVQAATALARIGGHRFWSLPHGEPEWVEVPAGEFWMGAGTEGVENERPQHRLHLESFRISKVPITNDQYARFVKATGHRAPEGWEEERAPEDRGSHPVVGVNWHDALVYCRWLSEVTGKKVTLPSEAEWEKAARGSQDQRVYPWGDRFEASRCNSVELGLRDTSPVGIFPGGASPYGCLDMAGNVWEWTRSLWGKKPEKPDFGYPYDPIDGREALEAGDEVLLVARGGSFVVHPKGDRCAARPRDYPGVRGWSLGFRVVLSPFL